MFWTRVWGRRPSELTVIVEDPVERGLMRSIDETSGASISPGAVDARGSHTLVLRPALGRDHLRLDRVRRSNSDWLGEWEATLPPGSDEILPSLTEYVRKIDRDQRAGRALVMCAEVDGRPVGQFSLSSVHRGALSQGSLGYWVSRDVAHMGVGSLCAALMIDLVIGELGLHRVEVNVRPENERSLGLCRKLGLREEGYKVRYMAINHRWADHVAFAIDAESLPEGGLVASIWGESLL